MALPATQFALVCVIAFLLLARPAQAFGAGNIGSTSAIEGQNWRHGDIEDVLLTLASSRAMSGKKFSKLDVKRVYFGNWLRDYSQAVDVGTVKYVSAKAITLLLWILGFMSFGYGTGEFEVTMERLGCYRPEDHIDNPKNYADNEDARNYDHRLRGPVNERKELAIDPTTGLKAYIASENLGITTSAGHVRRLFGNCIQLGRRYARSKNKADLYEALRLLGTACHCLEDYSAHSNYVELCLIEMGERDVFPHVGRGTQIRLREARYPVYPIITGTFGGVDFLHSVTGEFDDKVTQSEIQELENTMNQAQQNQGNTSILQDLLGKIPSGMFGGKDEAGKMHELQANSAAHQMQNMHVSPRQPEEWAKYLDNAQKQIYPIVQFHDDIMQSITEAIEKIPVIPTLIENLQDQLNIFVFSLIAPFILPVIKQIKNELNTGSSAIIESSAAEQHIVFHDDRCSDPTHSMLSKDHFSNVLNEPAGKVAGQVLKWVVPQVISAWDDERIDIDRTINRIIRGVFHHPVLRNYGDDGASDGRRLMFSVVEQWWHGKSEQEKYQLRDQLSRNGVEEGRNHKPGVKDTGHGSCKPLGMPRAFTASSSSAPGGSQFGQIAASAIGGGALGAIVGGLSSNFGGDILGSGLSENRQTSSNTFFGDDGSRTATVVQEGYSHDDSDRYGQARYSQTDEPYGGRTETYERYEETNTSSGWQTEVHREERTSYGGYREETQTYGGSNYDQSSYGGTYSRREEQTEYSSYDRRDQEQTSYNYSSREEDREEESTSWNYSRREEEREQRSSRSSSEHGYGRREEERREEERESRSSSEHGYGQREEETEEVEYREEETEQTEVVYETEETEEREEKSGWW